MLSAEECFVSCFVLPKLLFSWLYVVFSRLITSFGEDRADCSAIEYCFLVVIQCNCLFLLVHCHLIVALPGPSIQRFSSPEPKAHW